MGCPLLIAANDFFDVDRGIPDLAPLSKAVFDEATAQDKQFVRYNAPSSHSHTPAHFSFFKYQFQNETKETRPSPREALSLSLVS